MTSSGNPAPIWAWPSWHRLLVQPFTPWSIHAIVPHFPAPAYAPTKEDSEKVLCFIAHFTHIQFAGKCLKLNGNSDQISEETEANKWRMSSYDDQYNKITNDLKRHNSSPEQTWDRDSGNVSPSSVFFSKSSHGWSWLQWLRLRLRGVESASGEEALIR